jgi:hypothetical protein
MNQLTPRALSSPPGAIHRLTEYSGSFDSFERNIDGTIIGTRLDRDAARNSRSEAGRLEILANDVRDQLTLGKKLRTIAPGE